MPHGKRHMGCSCHVLSCLKYPIGTTHALVLVQSVTGSVRRYSAPHCGRNRLYATSKGEGAQLKSATAEILSKLTKRHPLRPATTTFDDWIACRTIPTIAEEVQNNHPHDLLALARVSLPAQLEAERLIWRDVAVHSADAIVRLSSSIYASPRLGHNVISLSMGHMPLDRNLLTFCKHCF
jgi:hypothetical protein